MDQLSLERPGSTHPGGDVRLDANQNLGARIGIASRLPYRYAVSRPLDPGVNVISEYQYYEFVVLDRALTKAEMQDLRSLSSRAEISSTRFANVYNYGNFRGDEGELMKRYFDAMIYVANWGTHRFMVGLPSGTVRSVTGPRPAKKLKPGPNTSMIWHHARRLSGKTLKSSPH
jgi:hypothetical protein